VSACLFVTGSGTDVGKTYVSELLVRALVARGVDVAVRKPLITGFDPARVDESDTARLLRASGREPTAALVDAVSPLRFTEPLSPDMAARRAARAVSFDEVVHASIDPHAPFTLIEGVGGVMVPLDDTHTVLDWIKALRAPALLVGGSALGSLSSTLTALHALTTRGIVVRAVVVNESALSTVPLDETVRSLTPHVRGVPIHVVTRGATSLPIALVDAVSPSSSSRDAAVSSRSDLVEPRTCRS
jgi:dethiobiotin synthetase